jgi:peroxiredoxin Q/BCP
VLSRTGAYASRHTVYIGADGKILGVDTSVSPSTAGKDIAAHLEKYGVAKRKTD